MNTAPFVMIPVRPETREQLRDIKNAEKCTYDQLLIEKVLDHRMPE